MVATRILQRLGVANGRRLRGFRAQQLLTHSRKRPLLAVQQNASPTSLHCGQRTHKLFVGDGPVFVAVANADQVFYLVAAQPEIEPTQANHLRVMERVRLTRECEKGARGSGASEQM